MSDDSIVMGEYMVSNKSLSSPTSRTHFLLSEMYKFAAYIAILCNQLLR